MAPDGQSEIIVPFHECGLCFLFVLQQSTPSDTKRLPYALLIVLVPRDCFLLFCVYTNIPT